MKQQYLDAGQIVSTHGIRGEVKVLPWADGPEFLTLFDRVYLKGREYVLESARVQKTCVLLKLQGVDTVEAAQACGTPWSRWTGRMWSWKRGPTSSPT